MSDSLVTYTKENSPTQYLCEKLNFKPEDPETFKYDLLSAALLHLCGEMPKKYTDASVYYARNKVKGDEEIRIKRSDGIEESINAAARLYPITGGFFIGLNPFRHEAEKEKNRSKWHELAHTLFYRWDGEIQVPEYEGMGWHPEGMCVSNALEEEICDGIAHRVCPKPCILLGGRPVMHYNLVKRLKEEDCEVHYISDEGKFENLLQKLYYMPWRIDEIIDYDLVIFDTGLITDELVEHKNNTTDVMDALREKAGMEPLVHDSREEYFFNTYFDDKFEDGMCCRDDTVIILADPEMADAIRPELEEREQRILMEIPYDIEDIVQKVRSVMDKKFEEPV